MQGSGPVASVPACDLGWEDHGDSGSIQSGLGFRQGPHLGSVRTHKLTHLLEPVSSWQNEDSAVCGAGDTATWKAPSGP